MGTTLENGIYLPDEGERNCYDGLAGNWVALDNHLGSTDIHVTINDKQAWNGHVADTTIHVTSADKQAWNGHVADSVKHVTAEDKQAWNGKADASALTAHTGNTTIHVTAEDKEAWNGKADASALTAHTGNTTIHVTAGDKNKWDAVTTKANDADVLHKSGNETVGGKKTFRDDLTIYNYDSSQNTKNLNISSSKIQVGDTSNSDAFGIRFNAGASFVAQILAVNDTTGTQNLQLSLRTKDGSDNFITSMVRSRLSANGNSSFEPGANNSISLGSSSFKWKAFNGVEPSSLSLPSGNLNDVIDISSYLVNLVDGTTNSYTAPANGWISIAVVGTSIAIVSSRWSDSRLRESSGNVRMLYPVLKNETLTISIVATTLAYARFIPCQGNV